MTPGVFSVMKEKARQYRRFPMFCVPADCLNGAAQQAPVVLLSLFFGPAVAGSFSLTHRVLSMPLVLLSQSIGGVFRQRASSQYNSRGDCRDVFSKTFKGLVLLSLVPFPLLFVAAPWLFCVVFGDQWRMAGEYARLLVPLFLVRFVSSPLTYVFYLREKQHYDLLGVTALLAASLSSMYVGNSLGSATAAITLFSALTCLVYLAYLLASQFLAQGNRQSVLTRAGRTVGQ
jgi:O-antigen/teichoic acid export membrane protein